MYEVEVEIVYLVHLFLFGKARKKVLDFLGFIICVAVVLGIVSVIALVGGSIMKIFGFRYESVGKIILFFLIFAIVGFPMEVFAQALPNALLSLDRISFMSAKVLFVFLDTTATTIAMVVVDHFMKSVSASLLSILVVAFLFAITSLDEVKRDCDCKDEKERWEEKES